MIRSTKRAWPALAFLIAFTPAASGQAANVETGSVAGRVVPPHDHGFTLTTARIPDLALQTAVAPDGSFRFERVRPGAYLVEVRVPSLGVAIEAVEVRAGEESWVEIEIRPGSHAEEILVTASAEARDPFELATPTTSLSGEELALRLEASLGETLAQEPGISSTFFGPAASRPIIRGLGGDRVRVLEGGLGTGDASATSADHAVTADPAQAERVEVLRGPATLLYGSSAIGGAVNVIDERIPASRASAAVGGTVELRAGSASDERLGSARLGGGRGEWAWHAGGFARAANDYEVPEPAIPGGVVANSDLESRGVRLGATRFFGDRGLLGVAVGGSSAEYGLPGGLAHGEEEEEAEEEEEGPVRIDLEQRRLDLRAKLTRSFGIFQGLEARLARTDYEHVELEGTEAGTFFFSDFFETRVELVQKKRGPHTGALGLQWLDRELEAVGEEAFLPPTASERWALFTFQEIEAGSLRWQLGGRYESQEIEPGRSAGLSSASHDGVSASAGLVWQATETWSLAAAAARSVKLPAAEELYSNGLHAATQAFEIGDPALGEEIGLGLDLSLRFESGRATGELTLFRQDFDGFIFPAFTGAEEEGFPVVVYRQRDAELRGAELKARVELFDGEVHHLHLRLVGDVVDADLDAGGNLPRIPPLRLGAGLDWHGEQWHGTAEVRYVDDQTDVARNETPTRGYTLWNASLGYRWLLDEQIVDLLLRGRNLGDEVARSHTSFLKDVAPLPGRDLTLAVKILF